MNQKKTLVFIHYFSGDGGSWQWLVKRLRKKFICIPLTLPGFGNTDPIDQLSIADYSDWVNEQIRLLELKNYVLCGHSLGAKIALYASQINKNYKPSQIILISPLPITSNFGNSESYGEYVDSLTNKSANKLITLSTTKKLRNKKLAYALKSHAAVHPDVLDWYKDNGLKEDISLIVNGSEISTFVIVSKKDPIVSHCSISSEVLPYLKNSKFLTLGKSGHLLPLESSRKLAKFIKRIVISNN